MTPGKGSKYREFYDLSGRITCMPQLFTMDIKHQIIEIGLEIFSIAISLKSFPLVFWFM